MIEITDSFIEKAKEYYRIYHVINSTKDYQNMKLWQQIQELEDTIFQPFFVFSIRKQFADIMTEFAYEEACSLEIIHQLFDNLKKESEAYFLAPQKTNKQILIDEVLNNESSMDILADMGFYPNCYSTFLVNKLVRKEQYPIQEIVEALNKEINNELSKELVEIHKPENRKMVLSTLNKFDFKFLIEFENYLAEKELKLIDLINEYPVQKEKDFMIIHSFEITKLEYFKNLDNDFDDEIKMYFSILSKNKKLQHYHVTINPQQLIAYLKNCIDLNYFDLICPMVTIFFVERNQNTFYEIDIVACYNEGIIVRDLLVLRNGK